MVPNEIGNLDDITTNTKKKMTGKIMLIVNLH